jgi:hypothetical protein
VPVAQRAVGEGVFMKNVSMEDFRAIEKKWRDTMSEPNGLDTLRKNNFQILIDGMVSKAVNDTELNINFFRQFGSKIGTVEYIAFRSAWEIFRKTIDVSV